MNRIHESLLSVFDRHRLVFWYDQGGNWASDYNEFDAPGIENIEVAGNEFGVKVRIVREPDPGKRFLIYSRSALPADADNWLLDLRLQGYVYKADNASLTLQELGLPQDYEFLVNDHSAFFASERRLEALKELVHEGDAASELRLKMMSVLAGTAADIDDMLLEFLTTAIDKDLQDPAADCLGKFALTESFWREAEGRFGYSSPGPTLRDFAVTLFRYANPLEAAARLKPHAKVFLKRWKDSKAHRDSYERWSRAMEGQLRIREQLEEGDGKVSLGDSDTFEIFDKFTLHRLCDSFLRGTPAVELRGVIQQRRASFWLHKHEPGYAAVENAVEMRELLDSADLAMDSLADGWVRYVNSWWRIDSAYRRCVANLRRYGQVQVMEGVSRWVEKTYVNNFLLPVADRWSDLIRPLEAWNTPGAPPQHRFFDLYVRPFVARGQKVFVVISDALRYEAAMEFAERLRSASRWTAQTEVLFGELPTYTQLGMASLLPSGNRAVDPATSSVTVDGRSATGTDNRTEILRRGSGVSARAIQAEEFLEMNSKTDGRALTRDHEVIYIFHNLIDKLGDDLKTEARTSEGVEQAFAELEDIIRKIANVNGSNMLLTADHGFLFQQDDVADDDMTPLPAAREWLYRSRRFALGRDITPSPAVKIFRSADLGLGGDWSAAFPLSLGRFPLQASGKRFVHGGVTLQEIAVPVVKIHKARTDDTGYVEVDLLKVPTKITTGQVAISVYQTTAVEGKTLPRTLKIGVFAKDGTELSEVRAVVFDSRDPEPRHRETSVVLVLSHAADAFNNREVEIRLLETVPGTSQTITYRSQPVKIQKAFASDFDE